MRLKIVLIFLLMIVLASTGVAEENVKFASLEWEPYVGPEMRNNGYVAEIVVEAFRRVDYKTEIIFFPWARAVKMAESGELDGVFPEYYDESRKEQFVFSDPFPGGPVGLYKRKESGVAYSINPQINQTEAFRGLQDSMFGVVRGYINTAEFDAAAFLKKEEVISDELNLKKLYNRRIDYIFIDKFVAEHLIKHKFPSYEADLEFMHPALEVRLLYIAFSKQAEDYQNKLKAFNSGLQQITQDGTLARIMNQHGIDENSNYVEE
ncbi:MAG: polar amino acid transport system substrate-binding protein [Desulforhopalus sp.]|jgi:polar amino acid transport system substrate-binding protein